MKFHCIAIVFVSLLAGCISSFQGIKMRAESPAISEAFKKLALAVTVDNYEIESVNHERHVLDTQWRDLKDNERLKKENGKVRLYIQLDERGKLFDIRVTPLIRDEAGQIHPITDIQHPLITKWKRILNSIVTKEQREED